MNKKFTTISIPTPIFREVERFISGTGFPSVSSFTAYLLREIVRGKQKIEGFTREDEDRIKKKLKEMGYL
ncbi:MAG: CopG family transcriptional regulator [Patescibacteria group bacterium]